MRRFACSIAAMGMLTSVAFAKEPAAKKPPEQKGPDMAAMMAAMEKAAAPGDNHKMLQSMVGTWTVASKTFMGGKPTESTGTAEVKSIMGDRFVEEVFNGNMMGKAFTGRAITGYDNTKKKFVSIWLDSMGTGIMMTEGTNDPATKTMTMTGDETDPMTGKSHPIKFTIKVENEKKHVMEMFGTGADGKDMTKIFEITYTKK